MALSEMLNTNLLPAILAASSMAHGKEQVWGTSELEKLLDTSVILLRLL